MTFLPIVARELRVAARQPSTSLLRFLAALIAVVIWLGLLGGRYSNASPAQIGETLFGALSSLLFILSLSAGVFLTADSLSSEKREGTLGLLFLTDLKGYDVVFGKLASTSLKSAYAMLGAFPVLALPLLLGGITAGQFGRVSAVLVLTLLLSLTCGLFMSALAVQSRSGMGATFLFLFFITAMLPLIYWVVEPVPETIRRLLLWPSPAFLFSVAGNGSLTPPELRAFYSSVAICTLFALLFLLGASVLLPLTWRDRVRVGSRRKITRRGAIARTVTNPFYHLARHGQASPALVWSLLLAMVGLSVGLAIQGTPASGGGRRSGFLLSFVTAFAAHQLIKYIIASEAGRRFSEDRRSGALEVLLVSPMRPQIMIAGQRLALWHLCRGPLALLAVLNLFLLANFLSAWPFGGGPSVTWSLGIVGGIVLLAADYYALSWTGMWHGLTSSRHHRAVLATLARVMLPPWLAAFFIVFGIGVGGMGIEDVLACWFAVSVVTSVIGGHLAQDRLRNEFRKVARDGFQASPRPWNFSFRSRRMPKPSAEQESAA